MQWSTAEGLARFAREEDIAGLEIAMGPAASPLQGQTAGNNAVNDVAQRRAVHMAPDGNPCFKRVAVALIKVGDVPGTLLGLAEVMDGSQASPSLRLCLLELFDRFEKIKGTIRGEVVVEPVLFRGSGEIGRAHVG